MISSALFISLIYDGEILFVYIVLLRFGWVNMFLWLVLFCFVCISLHYHDHRKIRSDWWSQLCREWCFLYRNMNSNRNSNRVCYFKAYTELGCVNAKSLPYVKDYTRWRLSGDPVYKITWEFVLLIND